MLFVSTSFLFFFVVVFAVYWLLRDHRARMIWLLLASAYFYMKWNPWLITLVAFSASIDYFAALALERTQRIGVRRVLLLGSVGINLGLLVYFKYVNFFLETACVAGNWLGLNLDRPICQIILPLGISFYTFETISYVVDVYRGKVRAKKNPLDYFLFILFFPHLIAGPIVRTKDFLPQVAAKKRWSWLRVEAGLRLILLGFLKKAVVADRLAAIVDPVYANPANYGTAELWLAAVGYSFQVYGDFSGYSDMAIGMAHLFGFKLHANFDLPFLASNPVELWQRWHISLSSWFRDYVYIPLGGSKGGLFASCRNLLITMTLSGFWHAATWNAVLWGLFHGVWLVAHRIMRGDARRLAPRPIAILISFTLFTVALVIFRNQTLAAVGVMFCGMVTPTFGMPLPAGVATTSLACIALAITEHAFLGSQGTAWLKRLPAPVVGAALASLLAMTLLFLPETGEGFIYFQF